MQKSGANMKGTITYLSDVIMAITSMFTTIFLLFVAAIAIFLLHINMTGSVYGDVYYDTPAAGAELTSILESERDGMVFENLLPYSVFFESEIVEINGKKYNAKEVGSAIIKSFGISEHKAVLRAGGKEILISKSGIKPEKALKCARHLVFAGEKTGELIFCSSRAVS